MACTRFPAGYLLPHRCAVSVLGLDQIRDILDYLGPRFDTALAELDCTLKPSGKMLATSPSLIMALRSFR